MSGERIFSKYQYGIEGVNTHGTIVNATHVLVGADQKPIPDDWKPVFPEDNLGVRARSSRSIKSELLVEDSISVARMYFQGLPFFFSCGLKGAVVANAVTLNSTNYQYIFTPDLDALNNPDSFTLEAGDNQRAYKMEYGQFKGLKLTGDIDQGGGESPVKIDAPYYARQVAVGNFTSGLSLGVYTGMSAKLSRLFVDTTWAGVGGTELTDTLRGFDLDLAFGNHPKFFGSPNLTFDDTGEGFVDALLTLTLEGNANADALYDAQDAQTFQAVRLKVLGPTIGNTNSTHALTVDLYGQWEKVVPLQGESSGNNLTQALFHALVDSTLANLIAVTVVTNTNTV